MARRKQFGLRDIPLNDRSGRIPKIGKVKRVKKARGVRKMRKVGRSY
jgi:hypothetical protein